MRLLVDRQNEAVRRRVEIEADHVAQLGRERRIGGQLEAPHPVRLEAVRPQICCTERSDTPLAAAIARPDQWVSVAGGSPSVCSTTRSTTALGSGVLLHKLHLRSSGG